MGDILSYPSSSLDLHVFFSFCFKLLHTPAARILWLVATCNSKWRSASDSTLRCCSRCNRFGSYRRCSSVRTWRNVCGKRGNSRSSSTTNGGTPCINSTSASRTRYAGRISCGLSSTWLNSLTQDCKWGILLWTYRRRFPKPHRLPIPSLVVFPTSRFSFRLPSALRPQQLDLSPLQGTHPLST